MRNSIDARVEFSFKGEDYELGSTIDLDAQNGAFNVYEILARDNGIDTISYLYEVMQEAEIEYTNAQGAAVDFLRDGQPDPHAFARHCQEYKIARQLEPIALRHLGVADLQGDAALKQALVAAYKLGRGE